MRPLRYIVPLLLGLTCSTAASAQSTLSPSCTRVTIGTQPFESCSWEIPRGNGDATELPRRGPYFAHLQAGNIETTINGQTTEREPGPVGRNSYWIVGDGATMTLKILSPSDLAVIETLSPVVNN